MANQIKEYLFENIQVNRNRDLVIELYDINKYFFQFQWTDVTGTGTIEVLASNDGINFTPVKYSDQNMILTISTASGDSSIADYIGHTAKYLCFRLSDFTDGYFSGKLNLI
jgi:hypothetical protein